VPAPTAVAAAVWPAPVRGAEPAPVEAAAARDAPVADRGAAPEPSPAAAATVAPTVEGSSMGGREGSLADKGRSTAGGDQWRA
jgi:hypothetical protein